MANEQDEKRNLLELLQKSEYYLSRRERALAGEDTEEFVREMEEFTAGLWRSLYDINQEIVKLREKLGITETKTSRLEELLLSQLFDNVIDGVTN